MRVLVTGIAGFIGYHTANRFIELGHQVIGIDCFSDYYDVWLKEARINNLTVRQRGILRFDLIDRESLNNVFEVHKPELVVHLAAQAGVPYSKKNPYVYCRSNIEATVGIFENAVKFNVPHVIYASSSSVYGNCPLPWHETQIPNPLSIYGVSKLTCEKLAKVYRAMYGLRTTGLRFFTVYGPWGRPDLSIWKFVEAAYDNKTINITMGAKRDYTYIAGVVDAIVKLAMQPGEGNDIFNVGFGHMISINDVVEEIFSIMKRRVPCITVPRESWDAPETCANSEKLFEKIGRIEEIDINNGLSKFIEWYIKWRRHFE